MTKFDLRLTDMDDIEWKLENNWLGVRDVSKLEELDLKIGDVTVKYKPEEDHSIIRVDFLDQLKLKSVNKHFSNNDPTFGKLSGTTTIFFECSTSMADEYIERVAFGSKEKGYNLTESGNVKYEFDAGEYSLRVNDGNLRRLRLLRNDPKLVHILQKF